MASKIKITYVDQYELCNRDHFLIVKGISILVAVIAYLCAQQFGFTNLTPIQEAVSAVFLICSGFGLSESRMKKGGLFRYWENKIVKIWIPSVVVLFIFSLINEKSAILWIAQSPVGLKGMFLYILFAEYLAFWLVFRLVEKKLLRVLCLFGISVAAYAFVPESLEMKALYFSFPVGVLFSQYGWKRSVKNFPWAAKLGLLAACVVVAVGTWFLASWVHVPYLTNLVWGICYIAIAAALCFGTYFGQAIRVFGVFVPVGMISYALYLLHDNVLAFLNRNSDWRMYLVVIGALIALSAMLSWLSKLLVAWNKKVRRQKKTHIKGAM